jgi:hypothetical protein
MVDEAVEEFARNSVSQVRDATIRSCDVNLQPTVASGICWKSVTA